MAKARLWLLQLHPHQEVRTCMWLAIVASLVPSPLHRSRFSVRSESWSHTHIYAYGCISYKNYCRSTSIDYSLTYFAHTPTHAHPHTECDIPGYCYDETTRRYYKLPPHHFAALPSFNKIIPSSKPQTFYTPTSKPSHDMSLYHLVQKRQLALSDVYYRRWIEKTLRIEYLIYVWHWSINFYRCLFKNSMRSLQLADTAKVPANITRANQLEVSIIGFLAHSKITNC